VGSDAWRPRPTIEHDLCLDRGVVTEPSNLVDCSHPLLQSLYEQSSKVFAIVRPANLVALSQCHHGFALSQTCTHVAPFAARRMFFVTGVLLQEDWGELNTGKRHPAVFVMDCKSWAVQPVAGLPDDATAGQPVWTPCGAIPPSCDSMLLCLPPLVLIQLP
jgi:hypothetical protein